MYELTSDVLKIKKIFQFFFSRPSFCWLGHTLPSDSENGIMMQNELFICVCRVASLCRVSLTSVFLMCVLKVIQWRLMVVLQFVFVLQPIRHLKYSSFKKSLLGSVSDSGNVTLWDVNTQNPYRNFENTHKAPASEICFSPVNELLLVTVGLDKRINLYDTSSKKWVRWRPLIFVGCERFMSWKSTSSYDIICLIQTVFRVVEVADTLLLENLFQNPFCFFSFN